MKSLNAITNYAVIFGGNGFIGSFLCQFLLDNCIVDSIIVIDIQTISEKKSKLRSNIMQRYHKNISYMFGDVRSAIDIPFDGVIKYVFNLAAIHREPGHNNVEYFQTNILGAENVCNFADKVGCQNLIFTSSISPYGSTEESKCERSLPIPITPYGSSKLVAEKIHQIWQAKDENNRRLVIVRPGVVFGPGEGGNVSRLVKAVINRYFFYMGNKGTRKAGVYVKELCNAIWWVFNRQVEKGELVSLFNMSMNPGPSISEYVETVCNVSRIKRFVPNIPYTILLLSAFTIDIILRPIGIKHPFSPVRIRKLIRSNNILPTYLVENGYEFKYTLESAFADWKKCCPEEWQ